MWVSRTLSKMKIGYFITHYPYEKHYTQYVCGGMETAASTLAAIMSERGHEISVFTTSIDNRDSVEKYENLTVYRYGANFKIAQANIALSLLWKPLEYKIDIVHTHGPTPPASIAALRYAKTKNKPLVVTYHGDAQANWGGVVRRISVLFYNTYLVHSILSHANSVIVPSKDFADNSKFLKVHRDKITVIPNGINIDEFQVSYSKEECRRQLGLRGESRIILFIGALSPTKSPDVILRAMPILKKSVPNIKLIFVGDGILKARLQKTSRELSVEEEVQFIDYVDNSMRKAMLYKSSDLFVLPSNQESFGIVILEAMASGLPVVASAFGGITNLVKDGQTGLLVPPYNSDILAKAIIKLLGNPELIQKLSEEGKKQVQNYSWSEIADKTEEIYQEVAG